MQEYYNTKSRTIWNLKRDKIRNTHNFLKSHLIETYIPNGASILDLGCGHGGDLSKFTHARPCEYTGIDFADAPLVNAICRSKILPQECKIEFQLLDFVECPEHIPHRRCVTAVVCNFAIHYAFRNVDTAENVIRNIAKSLEPGGLFLGTLPVAETSYELEDSFQVDDTRVHTEPTVSEDEFLSMCQRHGFSVQEWARFDRLFSTAYKTN